MRVNMLQDPENDINIADKPEHAQVIESLSRQLREKFPMQKFKDPGPKATKGAKKPKPGV